MHVMIRKSISIVYDKQKPVQYVYDKQEHACYDSQEHFYRLW